MLNILDQMFKQYLVPIWVSCKGFQVNSTYASIKNYFGRSFMVIHSDIYLFKKQFFLRGFSLPLNVETLQAFGALFQIPHYYRKFLYCKTKILCTIAAIQKWTFFFYTLIFTLNHSRPKMSKFDTSVKKIIETFFF
jgi:hypothetical protein